MEYIDYVLTFDLLSEIPRQVKKSAAYKRSVFVDNEHVFVCWEGVSEGR